MPLITDRNQVLDVYAWAEDKKWVIPTFCSENLTTTEAVLAAAKEHGETLGIDNPPVTIAITNLYDHRSQTLNYSHTRCWKVGLQLFLKDLKVLCGNDSPYRKMRVMVHLDHLQPDADAELLRWDMKTFSSLMFDASSRPLEENIRLTGEFVENTGQQIVIEGACDEISDASGESVNQLTTPERAKQFVDQTGADFIVANLGTEHRASAADLKYYSEAARAISSVIGNKIVLHGCSSISSTQLRELYNDGICKVNIWTALERDSSPALLREMVVNAAKVAGPEKAEELLQKQYLGKAADTASRAALSHFTTTYRQNIVYREMKSVAKNFFELWYR